MKGYIEERAVKVAQYIVDNNATVRQTAKMFGISKSTIHMVVTIWNVRGGRLFGWLNRGMKGTLRWKSEKQCAFGQDMLR